MTLAELRALAEAAQTLATRSGAGWYFGSEDEIQAFFPEDIRFIAAASPDLILAMLDVCEAARVMAASADGNGSRITVSKKALNDVQHALATLAEKMEHLP